MINRRLKIIAICCVTAVLLVLLAASRTRQKPLSSVASEAKRIVSLSPNLTELVYALGLSERLVGVSSDSDYPPAALRKTKVGTFWQPNVEAIIACKPDLIICETFEQQKTVADSLSRLGYRVLVLKMERTPELFDAISKLGDTISCRQQATELSDRIKVHLATLHAKYASRTPVKVLWSVQTEPMRVAGRNTFVSDMITLAGGENAVPETMQQYPQLGTEQLLSCQADVIIQSAMSSDNIGTQRQSAKEFWSRWPNLPAVKNKRIYVVIPDTVLRLGPRMADGVELIAKCLWPDANDI